MEERRNYSKAFKLEAVRLLSLGEVPASQLARELGVRRNQLYKWRDQLAAKGEAAAFSGPGRRSASSRGRSKTGAETLEEKVPEAESAAARIARLEREVSDLREERDILKKAAAYFARELP